jgi:tetratricopeptide (TPR) repeat protein
MMSDTFYDVFISYSTQDSAFINALRLALETNNRRVWQDVKELELSAEWWQQIKAGIVASDNFLFVVSPSSMGSPVCHLELEYARQMNKRIIIVRHALADKYESTRAMIDRILKQPYLKIITGGRDMLGLADENWDTIEAEQNIQIKNEDDIPAQVAYLVSALDKDLLHIRQGNILLGRAKEWLDSEHNPSFLLVGAALQAAEAWRDSGKEPPPTASHIAYINASRQAVTMQRRRLGMSLLVGAAAVGLAIVASIFSLYTQQRADVISDQIIVAEAQLTSIPSTLTPIGGTLQVSQTQIAVVPPTLTQAAVIASEARMLQEIAEMFTNSLIDLNDDRINPALEHLNRTISRHPEEGTAFLYRGIIYTLIGQDDDALKDLNEAIRLDPNLSRAFNNRGNIYYERGQFELAIADYDQAIRLAPTDAVSFINRGLAYADLGEYDQAIADYDRAIELDPLYAGAFNNRGLAYADLGEYDQAIADYDRAIELDPLYADAFNNRGVTQYYLNHYDQAIADYTKAIELNPEYAVAYNNRANSYYYLSEYELAIIDYTQAIELDPLYDSAFNNRGLAYGELGEYELAIEDFNQAIELDADYSLSWVNRGNMYRNLGEYDRAIAEYDRAIELSPLEVAGYFNRANVYAWDLEEYERAITDYDRAIELDPNDSSIYYNRGLAYANLDEYDQVIINLESVIALEPDNEDVYFNLGVTYYILSLDDDGNLMDLDSQRQAWNYWKQAEELGHPLTDGVREAMNEIEAELSGTS